MEGAHGRPGIFAEVSDPVAVETAVGELPGGDSGFAPLLVRRLGSVPYAEAAALQDELVHRRRAGDAPDTLLLLEHPHVITLGSSARNEHVLASDAERRLLGIELERSGRGGDVTYHGPGQLVGYVIVALEEGRRDLHRYLRTLERGLIEALATLGVESSSVPGKTGVWTKGGKIAAIGVRVSSGWITSHGFALNVSTDLRYFHTIVPCGIDDLRISSLAQEPGAPISTGRVQEPIAEAIARALGRVPVLSDEPGHAAVLQRQHPVRQDR